MLLALAIPLLVAAQVDAVSNVLTACANETDNARWRAGFDKALAPQPAHAANVRFWPLAACQIADFDDY